MKENHITPSSRRKPYWKDGTYQLLQVIDSTSAECTVKKGDKDPTNNVLVLPKQASVHFTEPVGRCFSGPKQYPTNDNSMIQQQTVRNKISQSQSLSSSLQIKRMTWGILVRQIDKLCLRIFILLFILTSIGILLPAYQSRKHQQNA